VKIVELMKKRGVELNIFLNYWIMRNKENGTYGVYIYERRTIVLIEGVTEEEAVAFALKKRKAYKCCGGGDS